MSTWFYKNNGVVIGPLPDETIRNLIDRGRINAESAIKQGDDGKWEKAGSFTQLFGNPGDIDSPNEVVYSAVIKNVDGDTLTFSCPKCQQIYTSSYSEYVNQKLRCQVCNTKFIISEKCIMNKMKELPSALTAEIIPDGNIICPHCWKTFPAEYLLYIAAHPSLVGDSICGEHEQKRFLPVEYNVNGLPLDSEGMPCTDMACPRCHLRIPSTIIDLKSIYFSIVGAPASGKSYYLTTQTHTLRKSLPEYFSYSFLDVDPQINSILNNYESLLFMNSQMSELVALPKTQQTGESFSSQIFLNGVMLDLPKPFIFELKPTLPSDNGKHMNMVFYDNAGEHFQPGADIILNPATKHLAHSNGIMFIFDPVLDAKMRKQCDCSDPQAASQAKTTDQNILMSEMISRIRRHSNLKANEKSNIPCVICVAKYDVWENSFAHNLRNMSPIIHDGDSLKAELDYNCIMDVSFAARSLLQEQAPAIINTAESFFESVTYIPVSNYGTVAMRDQNGVIGISPENINPIWVEIPMMLLLHKLGLIERKSIHKVSGAADMPNCQEIGNFFVFPHPETKKRIQLSMDYAECVLTVLGKKYVMPKRKSSIKTKAQDNFWQ